MRDPAMLQPGEFAVRTRLSPKALRLYAEQGLLVPAYVDEHNGYRYYAEAQVEQARLIGLLRRLGVPLGRISTLLDLEGPALAQALGLWWASVEADVAERRRLVDYLNRYLTGRRELMYDVELRQVEAQKLLSTTRRLTVEQLDDFIRSSSQTLASHLESSGAQGGWLRVIFHGMVTEDSDGPVEVAMPFTGSVEPVDDLSVRMQPAGAEAYTRLTRAEGEFPGILEAYDAVGRWIDANGMRRAGSPAEVYFTESDDAAPDQPYFDVAWPAEPT